MATLIFSPINPWTPLVTLLAAVAVGAYLLHLLTGGWRRIGSTVGRRAVLLVLTALSAFSFIAAAWNPVEVKNPDLGKVHLAVVVDVSDSVLRADGGWPQIQSDVHRFLQRGLDNLPAEMLQAGTGSVLTFKGDSADFQEAPLAELADTFLKLTPSDFAGGSGSNIGAGLERAARHIRQAGGRGEILLISDGQDTYGKGLDMADEIAQQGIPITIYPVASRNPELSLTSVNLPLQTRAQVPTTVRGMIDNQGSSTARGHITLFQNPGQPADNPGLFGPSLSSDGALFELPAGRQAHLRQDLVFQGVGLQFVDMALVSEDGTVAHRRRFFTHVTRPLKFLVVGDTRWITAVSKDVIEFDQLPAGGLTTATDLSDYDGLVLSAVPADTLDPATQQAIVDAVTQDGLGLMVINGDHQGSDNKAPTILRTYHDTVVEPLLPVSTEPRKDKEPPSRQVVIFIDTSGSMDGWPLEISKQIADFIITNLMRDSDYLDVVTFTTGAAHIIDRLKMDEAGKQQAINAINRLSAGGGTDPRDALQLIANRRMTDCGLIFLSDGYFEAGIASYRPDCRATAFAIGQPDVDLSSPLNELADPIGVGSDFDVHQMKIPFFNPEDRNFFEPGTYPPLSMSLVDAALAPLPVPKLELFGTAVSYPKEEIDLVAVRPKFVDPVLAYKENENGYVGVFTTAFPTEWLTDPAGQEAIQAWMLRIVAYSARDRYQFTLSDDGSVIEIELSLQQLDSGLPDLDALDVSVEIGDQVIGVRLDPVEDSPATYTGYLRGPRLENSAQRAVLVIKEFGPDALPRPQRILLLIPPAGIVDSAATTEAASYGLNTTTLKRIAADSGGEYNPDQNFTFFRRSIPTDMLREYWPVLVCVGAAFYLVAILMNKLRG